MELRELELKLKSAYLNKDRAAQIAEQEVMRFETMVSPEGRPSLNITNTLELWISYKKKTKTLPTQDYYFWVSTKNTKDALKSVGCINMMCLLA